MTPRRLYGFLSRCVPRVYWGAAPADSPAGVVLFPGLGRRAGCGIAGILDVHLPAATPPAPSGIASAADALLATSPTNDPAALPLALLDTLQDRIAAARRGPDFEAIVLDPALRAAVTAAAARLAARAAAEEERVAKLAEALPSETLEILNRWVVRWKDAAWALERDVLGAVAGVRELAGKRPLTGRIVRELHKLETILQAMDRLEIRGRDSLGLSMIATLDADGYRRLEADLARDGLAPEVDRRARARFASGEASFAPPVGDRPGTVVVGWRVAAEIGRLGDNVAALRADITRDDLLFALLGARYADLTATAHTRWASNGIINAPNCHPVDNGSIPGATAAAYRPPVGTIHVVLNGDIDNYPELRARFEAATGRDIEPAVTTDAKIIALEIERHYAETGDVREAFRRAAVSFEGSAAIAMHTDLAPGQVFLSLKGSGQALYVGLLPDGGYLYASEVYGLVGLTNRYLTLDGETPRDPSAPDSAGQVWQLDARSEGGLAGIRAWYFDGTAIPASALAVRVAQITTRDIDRQDFEHFFIKEIHQAPDSVAKTLRGKFTVENGLPRFNLGPEILPPAILARLTSGSIRRICCIGQGTAGVAAAATAEALARYLDGRDLAVQALRASDLSGFHLKSDMRSVLVLAVTQSGTTTDTNRAVEMARARGAASVAIVNRRDSAITEKVDGVYYTSDGRDVEMSVASTKAFYSQVAAGAVLALRIVHELGAMPPDRIAAELVELRRLPALLRTVLGSSEVIARAARDHAPRHRHWAVVGSGPNFVAAQEVRIKLSELCYKSIACDVVEDKKHIDLSSEPLILVLAAGNPESVVGDLVKDVAIFAAHKATPIVVASDGAARFAPYAACTIELPKASPALSSVLCTLAGHLWGYHAARAIDEAARPLSELRAALVSALDRHDGRAALALADPTFAQERAALGARILDGLAGGMYDATLGASVAMRLALLLGRRPDDPASWTIDLTAALTQAIEGLVRPIDAIKHQAKTVTVGTSRRDEWPEGPLFAAARELGCERAWLHGFDVAELKRLAPAIARVGGGIRYAIEALPPSGVPDDQTQIRPVARMGLATQVPSRTEGGRPIRGTKRTIVRTRRIHVGIGSSDGRRILIAPIYDGLERVSGLLLFHLEFTRELGVPEKIGLLGVGYEDLVNAVCEADLAWDDALLATVAPEDLLIRRPEELAARLVAEARR